VLLQELVVNLDQTGVHLLTTRGWGRAPVGSKEVPRLAADDKRQITVTLAVTASGAFLPPQLIFQGSTERVLPLNREESQFVGWHFATSDNHWSNADLMEALVVRVLDPYFTSSKTQLGLAPAQKCIVVLDVWAVHRSARFRSFIAEKFPYIILQYIPGGCTGKAQVLDVSVNKPLKAHMANHAAEHIYKKVCKLPVAKIVYVAVVCHVLFAMHTFNQLCLCACTQIGRQLASGATMKDVDMTAVKSTVALRPLLPVWLKQSLDSIAATDAIANGWRATGLDMAFDRQFQLSAAAALGSTSSAAEPDGEESDGDDGPDNAIAGIPMATVVARATAASSEFKQALEEADAQAVAELDREPVTAARRGGKRGGKRGKAPGRHTVGDGSQRTNTAQSRGLGRARGRGKGRL
jgi:hypothetical protein